MKKRIYAVAILLLLFAGGALAQSTGPATSPGTFSSVTWALQNPPSQVSGVSVQLVGNPGPATLYVWIVAHYVMGPSAPAGPFVLTNAPNVLSVSNYAAVTWQAPPGALAYDVLLTTSGTVPTGQCGCAAATSLTATSYNITSNTTNTYSVTALDPNAYAITASNAQFAAGVSQLGFMIPGAKSPLASLDTLGNLSANAATPVPTTVAGLALLTTATKGTLANVKDGVTVSDCTTGGGTSLALCEYNGSVWIPVSAAGGSNPSAGPLGAVQLSTGSSTFTYDTLLSDNATSHTLSGENLQFGATNEVVNPLWFSSNPDLGVDIAAAQASALCAATCTMQIPPGAYAWNTRVTDTKGIRFVGGGMGQTIITAGTSPLLTFSGVPVQGFGLENMGFLMTSELAGTVAQFTTSGNYPVIQNLNVVYYNGSTCNGTGDAFYSSAVGEFHAYNVNIVCPGRGFHVQGDGASELLLQNVNVLSPGISAFQIDRTTTTDNGGIYLISYKATNPYNRNMVGTLGQCGQFVFNGTAVTGDVRSPVFLNGIGGDHALEATTTTCPALAAVNWDFISTDADTWFGSSSADAVYLSNSIEDKFPGKYTSAPACDYHLDGNVSNDTFANTYQGGNTGFNFCGDTITGATHTHIYGNIMNAAVQMDATTRSKLAIGGDDTSGNYDVANSAGSVFVTRSDLGLQSMFGIMDASSGCTADAHGWCQGFFWGIDNNDFRMYSKTGGVGTWLIDFAAAGTQISLLDDPTFNVNVQGTSHIVNLGTQTYLSYNYSSLVTTYTNNGNPVWSANSAGTMTVQNGLVVDGTCGSPPCAANTNLNYGNANMESSSGVDFGMPVSGVYWKWVWPSALGAVGQVPIVQSVSGGSSEVMQLGWSSLGASPFGSITSGTNNSATMNVAAGGIIQPDSSSAGSVIANGLVALATDPSSPTAGGAWFNTALSRVSYYDGANDQRAANVSDFDFSSPFIGAQRALTAAQDTFFYGTSEPNSVIIDGDSIWAGVWSGVTPYNVDTDPLRQILQQRGAAGPGYIGVCNVTGGCEKQTSPPGLTWTPAGTFTYEDNNTNNPRGIGAADIFNTTPGDTSTGGTLACTDCNDMHLLFQGSSSNGTGTCLIDGVAGGVCASGFTTTTGSGSLTSVDLHVTFTGVPSHHTVQWNVATGTLLYQGAFGLKDQQGVQVHDVAIGSSTAANLHAARSGSYATMFQSQVGYITPDVVGIGSTGLNECANSPSSIPTATYRSNLHSLYLDWVAAAPNAAIVFLGGPDSANCTTIPASAYREQMREEALADGAPFLDLYATFSPYTKVRTMCKGSTCYQSGVEPHLNTAAGASVAEFMAASLFGGARESHPGGFGFDLYNSGGLESCWPAPASAPQQYENTYRAGTGCRAYTTTDAAAGAPGYPCELNCSGTSGTGPSQLGIIGHQTVTFDGVVSSPAYADWVQPSTTVNGAYLDVGGPSFPNPPGTGCIWVAGQITVTPATSTGTGKIDVTHAQQLCAGGSGGGNVATTGTTTSGYLPKFATIGATTTITNSAADDGQTNANTFTYSGTGGGAFPNGPLLNAIVHKISEGSCPAGATGYGFICANSSIHWLSFSNVGGAYYPVMGVSTAGTVDGLGYFTNSYLQASLTPPTANGVYNIVYNVTGGVAVPPTAGLVGLTARNVTGTTDTILYSDNNARVVYNGSANVSVTLPTATTMGNAHFYAVIDNLLTGTSTTVTITPTTWTIGANAASTLVISEGQSCVIYVDPNSSTNWATHCGESAIVPGSGIGVSRTNTGITIQLTAQYSKGSCTEVWGGSGTSFALTSGDDAVSNNSCYNDSGVTRTITAVKCRSDNSSNTTSVNPTFGSAGTGTTILSGALTCGNSYAYSSSGTVSNASWTTGSGIDPAMGGTLTGTSIAMIVEYTY